MAYLGQRVRVLVVILLYHPHELHTPLPPGRSPTCVSPFIAFTQTAPSSLPPNTLMLLCTYMYLAYTLKPPSTCIKVYPTLSREPSTFVAYSAASSTCMAHPVSTSTSSCVYRRCRSPSGRRPVCTAAVAHPVDVVLCVPPLSLTQWKSSCVYRRCRSPSGRRPVCTAAVAHPVEVVLCVPLLSLTQWTSSCVYRRCRSPSGRRPVCTAAVAHPVDVVLCVPPLSLTQWTSSCVYRCCRSPSGRRPVCTAAVAHPVDVVLCVPLLSLTQWTSSCVYRCCRSPSGSRPVCTAAVAHPVDVVLCVLSSSSSTRHMTTRRVIGLVILAHVVVICTMCEIIHV